MNFSIAVFSYNGHQNLLPYTLRSIKKHIKKYKEIVVVWDDYVRDKTVDFEEIKTITGVDFRVCKQSEIYNWPEKIGQWGWIRQQLAKMLCYTYITDERTFVVDSDVIFLKDPELFYGDKIFLRHDKNSSVPDSYKSFIEKYLGIDNFNDYTYVGSTCLFEHSILEKIEMLCRQKNNKGLVECVNDMLLLEKYNELPFSEFETYGHVCRSMFNKKFIFAEKNWNYCKKNTSNKNFNNIIIMWAQDNDFDLESIYKEIQG